MKIAIEASTGKVSLKDVKEAYASFGLDMNDLHLNEEHIIGSFQSRVSDAPRQEPELRVALKTIGQHRNSLNIEQFASNSKFFHLTPDKVVLPSNDIIAISTYEQALAWLGATADMEDNFIVSMYGVKVSTSPPALCHPHQCGFPII